MQKVLIIAEAGVNHNGNIRLAKEMVNTAYDAGADIIKFQTFKAEKVISQFAPKADYQLITTGKDESQLEMARKFEMSFKDFRELFDYCNEVGIIFLSTAADNESLYFLMELGQKYIKIPSGEVTNLPYLRKVGEFNKKIIMSTGMMDLNEIETTLDILSASGTDKNNITLLHCNTEYPTPMNDVNLNAMLTIKKKLSVEVGFSDHTNGKEISLTSIGIGSCSSIAAATIDISSIVSSINVSLTCLRFCLAISNILINSSICAFTASASPMSPTNFLSFVLRFIKAFVNISACSGYLRKLRYRGKFLTMTS